MENNSNDNIQELEKRIKILEEENAKLQLEIEKENQKKLAAEEDHKSMLMAATILAAIILCVLIFTFLPYKQLPFIYNEF